MKIEQRQKIPTPSHNLDEKDTQRRYIVELYNRICDSDEAVVKSEGLVEKLLKYTGYHFADQEYFMTAVHFPDSDYQDHKRRHREFMDHLAMIRRGPLDAILEYFDGWFLEHVKNEDSKIETYLQTSVPAATAKRWSPPAKNESEKKLREAHELYDGVFTSNLLMLGIAHLEDGRWVDVNKSLVDALGYSKEEFVGHTPVELGMVVDDSDWIRVLKQIRETGQAANFEWSVKKKSGEIVELLSSASLVNMGGVPCVISGHSDISGQKSLNHDLELAGEQVKKLNAELQRVNEKLLQETVHDPLTGLFNRRYLEEALDREFWSAARRASPVGVIKIDLDHFQAYNAAFGHRAGDRLLGSLAAILKANVRKGDIVCRYAGEEFVLILPDASLEATQTRAEFLRRCWEKFEFRLDGDALGAPTLSVGVAAFPQHGLTGEAAMHAADKGLCKAKAEGQNRVAVFGTTESETEVGEGLLR